MNFLSLNHSILQRSKPNLAKHYVSKCDLIVYDLHAGNPKDVKLAIDALSKPVKEGEETGQECTLILISSLLAWDKTVKNLEEIRNPDEPDSEEEQKVVEVKDGSEKDGGEEGEAEIDEDEPKGEPSQKSESVKGSDAGDGSKEGDDEEQAEEEEEEIVE